MFESFTSRPTPAESLLAQTAGREPAAAIMGDLNELAATRGRFWFWTAYTRTLISIGWSGLVAFVAGLAAFWLMMDLLGAWMRAPKPILSFGSVHDTLASLSTAFLAIFASSLWFAAPYVFLRFGYRDRVAQLYGIFFLLTTPFLIRSNPISLICALLTLAIIVAALLSTLWRKPIMVLAATSVTVLIALETGTDLVTSVYHPHFRYFNEFNFASWIVVRLTVAFALANTAILCTWLHDRLLRPRLAGGNHA